MAKHIGILVSPEGEEFYDAYGPMTKLRDRATRFATAAVAAGAADQRYGRHDTAFWNSERTSRDLAVVQYRGWTSRTEEVADNDVKRAGHFVLSYAEGSDERVYARPSPSGGYDWGIWRDASCGRTATTRCARSRRCRSPKVDGWRSTHTREKSGAAADSCCGAHPETLDGVHHDDQDHTNAR